MASSLLGLLALLIIPVIVILAIFVWRKRKRRARMNALRYDGAEESYGIHQLGAGSNYIDPLSEDIHSPQPAHLGWGRHGGGFAPSPDTGGQPVEQWRGGIAPKPHPPPVGTRAWFCDFHKLDMLIVRTGHSTTYSMMYQHKRRK